ncbi:uncharacterized protein LOC117222353 [Megalopta genalis]|uniref:uncharacterized protein LOC117222353 n=1 Tax=Megalopta genalis TaxID=115081 RepID=UPI0014435679|nr:GRIP and coiled-coil domain-containing protein 2-like [Megalopta genalis]XP_033329895.1 GRIP and coiled-coil domain-containing protein 2-like [Megalopta genalis]
MHQEENKHKSPLESCNMSPQKLQRFLKTGGSEGRDVRSRTHPLKRTLDSTPHNSPQKRSKTPESRESIKKDEKLQVESGSSYRKSESYHHENTEKINKPCTSGKFVNTLIEQWSKHMGVENPFVQTITSQESPIVDEMKRKLIMEERKIQLLTKKLKTAEETISSLSASREAEAQSKEEIFKQLNSDWESITNYYAEISQSLKGFQQHKDNLYKLYNNITVMQETAVKKLQQELNTMKLKDDERKNICAAAENTVLIQEKRIHEMMIAEAEFKKLLENVKSESVSEKNRLQNAHAEEKVELMKKQEKLTSTNIELQGQIQNVVDEKQNLTELLKEKDKEISALQQDISTFKNKIENLLSQIADLSFKYEKSVEETTVFKKELESKMQEIDKFRENLRTRQEVESSLAKDLDMINTKYIKASNDFATMENKLKDMEARNSALQKKIYDMTNTTEREIAELKRDIEFMEKEKKKILSEKRTKIQEQENSIKLMEENYETELAYLKKDFDAKLSEMKYQAAKFSNDDTLSKMGEETRMTKRNEAKENKARNTESRPKQQQLQAEKMSSTPKITSRSEEIVAHDEQDIYSFTTQKISGTVDKVPDYKENLFLRSQRSQETEYEGLTSTQKKKRIFKTRETGLRQYTSTKKIIKK